MVKAAWSGRRRRWAEASLAFLMAAALVVVAPGSVPQARAATFQVDVNDPGCNAAGPVYCGINEAIAVATTPGDVIQVAPGTYDEAVGVFSRTFTIESTGGASVTTINATPATSNAFSANGSTVTLRGFTLTGAARTFGNPGGGIWLSNTATTLTLEDSIVTGNTTGDDGGGISSWGTLNVVRSVITGNSARYGGGITSDGTTTIIDSTISANTASIYGGGIYHNDNSLAIPHTIDIDGSTFSGNLANGTYGGGLAVQGGTADIVNSTFSGNEAAFGGGIATAPGGLSVGAVQVNNTTIVENIPRTHGGGVHIDPASSFNVANTIITENLAGANTTTADCNGGTLTVDAPSVVGVPATTPVCTYAGAGTVLTGTTNLAGNLTNNGGLTDTYLPGSGTVVIDAGSALTVGSGYPACAAVDQRDTARPEGSLCDIGAVEAPAVVATLQALIDAADPGETIDVDSGTYNENITIGDGKTLRGTGASPGDVVIDGGGNGSTVSIGSGDAAFENLTIDGGSTEDVAGGIEVLGSGHAVTLTEVQVVGNDAGSEGGGIGGGMYVESGNTITVVDSVFSANISTDIGGAIYLESGSTLDVAGTTFENNLAYVEGGAIYNDGGTVTIVGSLFDNNDNAAALVEGVGYGGAIYNGAGGDVAIESTTFIGSDSDGGGAIYNAGELAIGPVAACATSPNLLSFVGDVTFELNTADTGGAIYHDGGTLSVSETDFTDNQASGEGGAIFESPDVDSLTTVTCTMFAGNDADGDGGAYYGNTAAGGGTQEFMLTSFFDNTAIEYGGAMLTLSPDTQVTNSLFDTNSADIGGAIYNDFNLTVARSTLVGNQADSSGAGIHSDDTLTVIDSTISGNTSDVGGGIYSLGLTMVGSTVEGNVALSETGTAGGGVLNELDDVDIHNSTFSGNNSASNGGGLGMTSGIATINNVSFVGNVSTGQGAAFNGDSGATIFLSNSLASGNMNGDGGPNCASLVSAGYNLLGGNPSGCTLQPTDIIGDAMVGPLADNGGPTQTHELLAASPAIDAGNTLVNYQSFTALNLVDWQLNGVAGGNAGELLLASGTSNAGSAFVDVPVNIDLGFSAQFDFRIVPDVSGGADGLSFVIADDPTTLGSAGGFLGTSVPDPIEGGSIGIVNGISVEFDTWVNGSGEGANDPDGNHIGININGSPFSISPTSVDPANLSDGSTWTAWIDYDSAADLLEVRASNTGSRPVAPTVATNVVVEGLSGSPAYVGFAGATGSPGIAGDQRVVNFIFVENNSCEATDQRGVIRPQRDACDIGAFEVDEVTPTALTVNIAASGPQAIDSPVIPIDELNVGTFFGVPEGPSSTQLGAIQLGAIQLGAIENSGFGAPSGHLTIAAIIDAAAELSAVPTVLDEITLDDVPVAGGWEQYLVGSGLEGRPPYTVTLQQAIDDPVVGPQLPELQLAESGLAASQLGAIQLGAIQLGAIQLGAIQLGAIQLGAIGAQLADICADPAIDCSSAGLDIVPADPATYEDYSIMALALLGVDLDFTQLGAIQLGAIGDPVGTQLGAIQLGAIQLGAIDTDAGTIGNTQLGAIQLGAIQLGAIQLGAIQANIDPAIGSTITDLLDYWCGSTSDLDCAALGINPSDPTTAEDYSILALGAMGADLGAIQLGAIQLGAIDNLESTQLGAIQLGAIQLSGVALEDTQLGAIQLGAIQLGAIQLGAIDFSNPVFAQLGAIQLGAIQLGAIGSNGTLVPNQLGAIQLGAISDPSLIVNCGDLAGGCTANGGLNLAELQSLGLFLPTASLDDLVGAIGDIPLDVLTTLGFDIVDLVGAATIADLLPETTIAELPPDLTLAELDELWVGIPLFELLLALMDPAELSWEDVDAEVIAADNPVLAAGFSVNFELQGDILNIPEAEFPFTADVSVTLPDGVEYVPGTSQIAVDPLVLPPSSSTSLPDPEVDENTLRWIIDGVQLNQLQYLEFVLSFAFTADTSTPIATTVNVLGETAADTATTIITDLEPNDTFADAVPIDGDVVVLGRIGSPTDVDMFRLTVPPGGTIEAYLNPGGVDLDLVLFEPGQTSDGELRGPAERVVDGSLDPVVGIDPTEQDQESLNDITNTDLAPVFKASLHRDDSNETIVTPPLRDGGDFYLQITPYQEIDVDEVYVGRVRVIDPPTAEACLPRVLPSAGDGSPGSIPTDLTGAQTIYVMNQELFGDTYGATATADVLAAIAAINSVPDAPQGFVIPVEDDPAVAAAYADWLGTSGNCSVASANTVAKAIAALVDDLRATYPTIDSVVIIGGDDQVPFFRVKDEGVVANERDYLTTFSGNNPLVASLRDGMVLTDSPYVDYNPLYVPVGDREVFVPNIPIGRLVEEPVEIVASLNQYVIAGGYLDTAVDTGDPQPGAQVLGYDFLADASQNIAASLTALGYLVESVISETWGKTEIKDALDSGDAVINANAHYDHTAALPAESNLNGTLTDLYTVDDLQEVTLPGGGPNNLYAGSTIYTMGCHAGLNAPGSYLSPTDDLYDWSQALLNRGALYIANTGFGFGDSDIQAYSEELMALFTEQLGTSATAGEAFLTAQQLFAGTTPKWSPYHDKSLMEATLYGLPFYRLHLVPPPPPGPSPIATSDVNGTLQSASVSTSATLTTESTDDGDYLVADDVLAVPFRPIQPLEEIEVTPTDGSLRVTGAIVESGSTTDLAPFDVLYARPILFDESAEPEFETIGAFPNALQAVTSYNLPGGRVDQVLLSRGRYFPSILTQQRWDSMALTVYYAPASVTDISPPTIGRVAAIDQGGGTVNFEVIAEDDSGILRVLVLYKPEAVNGAWTPLPLSLSGGVWQAQVTGLASGQDLDYWVQVLGGDGQVASSTDKAELHEVLPPSPPSLAVSGTAGNNGIFVTDATVELTPPLNAPSTSLEISTDGGATFVQYSGPVTLGDGDYAVVGRPAGFAQSAVTAVVSVDTTAPTVTVVSPATSPIQVAQNGVLKFSYFCEDGESGLAKCKGTVLNGAGLNTAVLGTHTVQVTATDRAGNTATAVVEYQVIDEAPLVLTADATLVAAESLVTFTLEYSSVDNHVITWDFGDGSATEEQMQGAGPAMKSHVYDEAGVYPVTVTVLHESGLLQTTTLKFIVVYDPTAGFVTGGGWIDSPPGAYTPSDPDDPDVVGVAEFGFVSKYKKGRSTPTGNASFEFESAGLDFHSTSYQWLVVQGQGKAAFKGVGIIDGIPGEFKFRVTVWDADVNDNDAFEVDRFRMQIWTTLANGEDYFVYDNGFGIDPDLDPQGGSTEIGGGSIVIHVPKGKGKK